MRHGSRWADTNKRQHAMNRKMKMLEESASFEKFVGGANALMTASCVVLKSSMLFCKSRMLRKKSFDISAAGLIVLGGASGGPWREYTGLCGTATGGGGWRARNAGTKMKSRAEAIGRIERR